MLNNYLYDFLSHTSHKNKRFRPATILKSCKKDSIL